MYAVVKTGGRQYKVQAQDVIRVQKLDGEAGSIVRLEDVIAIGADGKIETGSLDKAAVGATVVAQDRDEKVISFKKRRRQNSRRKRGHRQQMTVLRIEEIAKDGNISAKPKSAEKKAAPKEAKPAAEKKEAAPKKAASKAAKKPAAKKADK